MAEKKPENTEGSQVQANSGSTSVGSLNVGGNVGENFIVGNNNVINYHPVVEKNTEKHEPDFWALKHPYPMPPNFTGRIAERALLTHWLKEDLENRLFILRALGGFGKSALTWHWLTHDVDIKEYPKVVFWSFYEGDASFEHFIEETLKYLKLEVPQGGRPQVDELLKAMQGQKILLIMDGFERALRAYSSMNAAYQGDSELPSPLEGGAGSEVGSDCVNINAEIFLKSVCSLPNIKSKVLMTTRLTPRAVKPRGEFMLGCREEKLEAMQKADAVEFFHKQKIKGTHAEIEAACAPYGYHPLSLRLLAGRILKDFENPTDIIVAQKLKIDGDIIQQKHHVLEVAYNSLPSHEQKLLSTIACFRSPVELKTLQAIAENKISLNNDLHDLVVRSLLHFDDKNKKFDLHPIVRRYSYERLTTPDRTGAHEYIIIYFGVVPKPEKIEKLEDLAPVIELYHHMVRAGKLDEARELFRDRLNDILYFQFGAYQLVIELLLALFLYGENKLPPLREESAQAWTLSMLANAYSLSGQPQRAAPLYEKQNYLQEKNDSKINLAIGLGALASVALSPIGKLRDAERNMRRRIDLCRENENEFEEAVGHHDLGRVLSYRGAWQDAEQELDVSVKLFEKVQNFAGMGVSWSYKALGQILIARESMELFKFKVIYQFIQNAVNAQNEWSKRNYPIEREKVRNVWLFGVAYRMNSDLTMAEENLSKAINLCRQINLIEMEADILLDLARLSFDYALRQAQSSAQDRLKHLEEAKSLADEALSITERCGFVLQGADVNLFLAQYALEQEKDKAKAREYAETALKLATCDGPPYYYKVAYEEAERILAGL